MQDGLRAEIKLLSYHKINGVVFYNFQIYTDEHIFKWSQRYSRIKQICSNFPATSIKFPPKDTFRSLINNLTFNQGFLSERFELMTIYFQSISNSSQLRFNRAFLNVIRNLDKITNLKAPVIKGKKLKSIEISEKNNYILV